MMIHKILKGLERMEVFITSHMKIFLGNKSNSYTHTARNANVTSTRIVYEKTVMKHKFSGAYLETTSTCIACIQKQPLRAS